MEEKLLWPRGWVTQGPLNILATERGPPGRVLPSLGPGGPAYTEEETHTLAAPGPWKRHLFLSYSKVLCAWAVAVTSPEEPLRKAEGLVSSVVGGRGQMGLGRSWRALR